MTRFATKNIICTISLKLFASVDKVIVAAFIFSNTVNISATLISLAISSSIAFTHSDGV